MATCNAHYYATRDPLGECGDFTTAPEISQMFGEMVGAALADVWMRAGKPERAVYAELGPGRGTLAADALRVLGAVGFEGTTHLVENSPTLRAAQSVNLPDAKHHDRLEELPPRPLLLAANEFFDALPTRQFGLDGERQIKWDGEGFFFTTEEVQREESPSRLQAMRRLAGHLKRRGGCAFVIDYGYWEGSGDTLQALRAHEKVHPLTEPGECDLTTHVDFGALAEAAREEGAAVTSMISQGSWLETLGIGARASALAAANPERTESIAHDRRRLCDEAEMGTLFKVMAVHSPDWPAPAGFPE
ncbi:SAM-dependent methyltransferase [Sphingomicrobium sp. B8]|uniref:SAM-dependent methyltransferase n=2 Tax=Sphingomicrobium clamense TaxID=2851013 RepID=A0ABS6V3T0_9SPHN|nr:SAM-dependent methyltransferase [Sphingomicrobium sp. B8]MBW0144212.1 SAM-dependent methyltransferase [Sphingomicrobium sp. B8]